MSLEGPRTWQALEPWRTQQLVGWLRRVGSTAGIEEARALLDDEHEVRTLAAAWDAMSEADRQAAMSRLSELMRKAAYATRPGCRRCGTCCRRSGPTLFPEDRDLVLSGVIPRWRLCTFRPGSRVRDPMTDGYRVLDEDLVRVAPAPSGGCPFFHEAMGCTLYDRRPLQCRVQACWDIAPSEALLAEPGISRLDLLDADDPWRALVSDLDRCCPAGELEALGSAEAPGDAEARIRLGQLLGARLAIRRTALSRCPDRAAELPFLLGAVPPALGRHG